MQGTEEWRDITVTAPVTISLASAAGVAVRVGGLRRYYAFVLAEGGLARIVKAQDGETVLAEVPFAWETEQEYSLSLSVPGTTLTGSIDGQVVISATDDSATPLRGGGIGLLICRRHADEWAGDGGGGVENGPHPLPPLPSRRRRGRCRATKSSPLSPGAAGRPLSAAVERG